MSSNAAFDLSVFDNDKPRYEGRIARKSGSRKLYFDFFYHGVRIEKSTGMDDTPANRMKAEAILKKILAMKKEGTLEFVRLFPHASPEEIAFHTRLEKGEYAPTPKGVTFGEYVRRRWYPTIWAHYPQETKKQDFKSVIDYWLLPHFGDRTFFHITGTELQRFVATLKHRRGPKAGEPLSRATQVNILQIMRTVWSDAVEEHRWMLFDPFRGLKKHLPRKKKKTVEVFRHAEWQAIVAAMEPFYRPVAKLMILTGLMASEVAALRAESIREGYLHIERSVVRGVESEELKTQFRERRIRITKAIGTVLEEVAARSQGGRLFTMADGSVFTAEKFQRRVWKQALEKAEVPYRKPYTTRHSFAAWSLTVGIDPNRLVHLMGHASKQMIFEVYGRYTEGLEEDRQKILDYFGEDFLAPPRHHS